MSFSGQFEYKVHQSHGISAVRYWTEVIDQGHSSGWGNWYSLLTYYLLTYYSLMKTHGTAGPSHLCFPWAATPKGQVLKKFKEEDGFGLCCSSRHYSGVQEAARQSSGVAKATLASSESELGRKMMGLQCFWKSQLALRCRGLGCSRASYILSSSIYKIRMVLQSEKKKKKRYGAIC